MRTRTFVLIGIGLTLLSSLFLGLGQIYLLYRGEIRDWIDFVRRYAWRPGFEIWKSSIHEMPNCIFDSAVGWFLLLSPGVLLFAVLHPFRKAQKIVLGMLVLLTVIDLCWLLLERGVYIAEPDENYVAAFLHLVFSILSLIFGLPLVPVLWEELRRAQEKGMNSPCNGGL